MLISRLVGERSKTTPSDAQFKSHALMLRAGFMKQVSNGIWTLAMPAKRIANKIESIIREEMDLIDGQECLFPVVLPRDLLDESGRYESIGLELVRFKDRNNRDNVLGMTHEEAAVHLARNTVSSYQQLPFMIYQIQTKFRDEARSRGGLIRVREFTMKDAYSFHETQEDLEKYYKKVYDSYIKIFKRIGMKNFIVVESDSGMMGGKVAHEYMLLTPIGEDSIVICKNCGYKSNMEVAVSKRDKIRSEEFKPLEKVYTGEAKEISEVVEFLKLKDNTKTLKAVVFNIKGDANTNVLCFIRGDLEINEAKLKKVVKKDIVPASLQDSALVAGNIGPVGLNENENLIVVYDDSVKGLTNVVVGANEDAYHMINACEGRDFYANTTFDIAKVQKGDKCIVCGSPLTIENGIEIGNIFQLGTRYTETMNMNVLDKTGKTFHPIMGCYGIGVGRAIASIAEEKSDDFGLIWPMSIAPWHVYLCPIRFSDEDINSKTLEIYDNLKDHGIEVLLDDRDVSPGFKFADCDLMGIPIRVVVSKKLLEKNELEIQLRESKEKFNVPIDNIVLEIQKIITHAIKSHC
ncbi:MAG: proline--tRNA ligase [Christensenellales bacterium]|jgi:prolyl-tRNA synthetase|nr:proline--tRNA ligase [Clostridiales bacterium]